MYDFFKKKKNNEDDDGCSTSSQSSDPEPAKKQKVELEEVHRVLPDQDEEEEDLQEQLPEYVLERIEDDNDTCNDDDNVGGDSVDTRTQDRVREKKADGPPGKILCHINL